MNRTILPIDCLHCPKGHRTWQEYANCLVEQDKKKVDDAAKQVGSTMGKNLVKALKEALEFEQGKRKLRTSKKASKKPRKKK